MSIHTDLPVPVTPLGQMGPQANRSVIDVWSIAHGAAGYIAGAHRVGWLVGLSGALAVEAIEIGLSARAPDLAAETKRNMVMDLAIFAVAYHIGATTA